MSRMSADLRIDPRIRRMLGAFPEPRLGDISDRAALLAEQGSASAQRAQTQMRVFLDAMDDQRIAPADGLVTAQRELVSRPDGNTVHALVVKPVEAADCPGVCFLHGGAMQAGSCTTGNYQAWARMIAAQGVVVVMIDFRNAIHPSSVPEIAPFPAGLNDCISGLRWFCGQAAELGADPTRIVLAGDSGGANLAFATAMALKAQGDTALISGIYAISPFLAGQWPLADCPSSIENNGIVLDLHSNRYAIAYGVEEFTRGNPLAWPYFASPADLTGLPRTVITVNEYDPLRDEGVRFYQRLLAAGVPARCQQQMGTVHDIEVLVTCCPDISRAAAQAIAAFAADPSPTAESLPSQATSPSGVTHEL